LGDDVTTPVVRYVAELTLDEYVESAGKALPDRCVLVAESFSGPVAITLAARHPGKVRCLVLTATFAGGSRMLRATCNHARSTGLPGYDGCALRARSDRNASALSSRV